MTDTAVFTSQRYTCMLTNVISSFALRKSHGAKIDFVETLI